MGETTSTKDAALVTGASSGIGRAVAHALARRGHPLILGYSSGETRIRSVIEDLHGLYGTTCRAVHLDLRDPATAAENVDAVIADAGAVGCLVNNAGINDRTPAASADVARMAEVFAINALSPIALASVVGRHMIDRGIAGTIVNVTSVHETIPITGGTFYCAAKAALGMSTKVMALEFAPHGIRVNSVAPGETATAMNGADESDYLRITRPDIPFGRPAGVGEVASLVAYLASPDAAYVTGGSVTVDGGLSLTAAEANARRGARAAGSARDSHDPTGNERTA